MNKELRRFDFLLLGLILLNMLYLNSLMQQQENTAWLWEPEEVETQVPDIRVITKSSDWNNEPLIFEMNEPLVCEQGAYTYTDSKGDIVFRFSNGKVVPLEVQQ